MEKSQNSLKRKLRVECVAIDRHVWIDDQTRASLHLKRRVHRWVVMPIQVGFDQTRPARGAGDVAIGEAYVQAGGTVVVVSIGPVVHGRPVVPVILIGIQNEQSLTGILQMSQPFGS